MENAYLIILIVLALIFFLLIAIISYAKGKKPKIHTDKKTNIEKESSVTAVTYKKQDCPLNTNAFNLDSYGEYQIYEYLKCYESQGCKFLFNVYLPKNNGETTEIDALMISPKGIFVFESKNFKGYIEGSEKDQYWTQTKTDKWGESITGRFYNPIKQNEVHILSLQEKIKHDYPVISIVVFSDKCELYYDSSPTGCETQVVSIIDLQNTVESFFKYMQSEMSDDDIQNVYNLLYPYTQVSDKTKMRHIQDIKNNHFGESGTYSSN